MSEEREKGEQGGRGEHGEHGEHGAHGEHDEHGADDAFGGESYAITRPGGSSWTRSILSVVGTLVALLLAAVLSPKAWSSAKTPQLGAPLVLAAQHTAAVTTPAAALTDTVWANEKSRVYHCPGTRYFGATKRGMYVSEAVALERGYRAVGSKRCRALSNLAPETSPATAAHSVVGRAPTAEASQVKVWVNTASGVYHCAGSRYYGETAQGKYMTQAEARTEGHRGVRGKSCN